MEALEGLKKQGLKQLVLDLRGNGGGILEEAVEMADEFLDGDKLITYTEGKHAPRKEYRCRRVGQFEKGTLAILADEGTASASEVLIGALQDWDRAIIIGRRTFGKGLVGQQFELSDNSALRLTIARYYTPLGRSIQRNYAKGGKAYFNEISNRYHDGETQFADSVKNDSSKVYHSKSGKKLFGGGGISPDYFIALDTSDYSLPQVLLAEKNTLQDFAYRFYLQNQTSVKNYKDCNSFIQNFSLPTAEWDNFIKQASKDSISLTNLNEAEKKHILLNIKAAIARMVWHTQGFVEVLNTNDEGVIKSLQLLEKN
jgi:carboxyl-terminal processing protease